MSTVFFGYPSRPPMLRESMSRAAGAIDRLPDVNAVTWEQLHVSGKVIITEILRAIDESNLCVFELTDLNQNVMFELGYCIGSNKRVWLLRDRSKPAANRRWEQVKILTTVGHVAYSNSEDIAAAFLQERPELTQTDTIFETSIQPTLASSGRGGIFFLTGLHDTEAGRDVARRINREREQAIHIAIADAREAAVQPLAWYAQQIDNADVIVSYLESPQRAGAEVHNARGALISGVAVGMGKPLLMLAESDYLAPIDYRDYLYVLETARDAVEYTDRWLTKTLENTYMRVREASVWDARRREADELRHLRLGDPLAENEEEDLSEYFVETAAFRQVLDSKTVVFAGRKGAGKTANVLRAAAVLKEDRRQLVCVIKPVGYELEAVVRLLHEYAGRDAKTYVIESLWKFLLYSEIALVAAAEIESRPGGVTAGTPEWELVEYLAREGEFLTLDFGVRLERTVARLSADRPTDDSVEALRQAVTASLHEGVLSELRRLLGNVLASRDRVAVLVDNLDKAWDKGADLGELSVFLLGLLSAVGRIDTEFHKSGTWRKSVNVTLAIFIRSDILTRVLDVAREPDKIPVSRLEWTDSGLLLRVIEERYVAGRPAGAVPEELWHRFFSESINGRSTPEYLVWRALPRPRDVLVLCNAAIAAAVNRGSHRVEETDMRSGELIYSQFAFEALKVEEFSVIPDVEDVLFQFAGADAVLSEDDVIALIKESDSGSDAYEVLLHLRSLSFLGVETQDGVFDWADDPKLRRRAEVLAARVAERRDAKKRYSMHPAFRPYLDVADV